MPENIKKPKKIETEKNNDRLIAAELLKKNYSENFTTENLNKAYNAMPEYFSQLFLLS